LDDQLATIQRVKQFAIDGIDEDAKRRFVWKIQEAIDFSSALKFYRQLKRHSYDVLSRVQARTDRSIACWTTMIDRPSLSASEDFTFISPARVDVKQTLVSRVLLLC
jgi:hypothetical protein